MARQRIMWTILPNGFVGANKKSGLNLSVFVSPQLIAEGAGDDVLGAYPDWLSWPALVATMKFRVQFANSGPPILVKPLTKNLDGNLWSLLFNTKTFVRSYEFDAKSDRFVMSYPIRNVLQFLRDTYANVAINSPSDRPNIKSFLGQYTDGTVGKADGDLIGLLRNYIAHNGRGAILPKPPKPSDDLAQFQVFHHVEQGHIPPPQVPTIDFHQMVAALAEFPVLMRMLGLVIDLHLPYSDAIRQGKASTTVSVAPASWNPTLVKTATISPKTAYTLTDGSFVTRASTGLIQDGFLHLQNGAFDLVEIDVDGAAMKNVNLAISLQGAQKIETTDTPKTAPMPALRSAGISLVQTGRAAELAGTLKGATSLYNAVSKNSDVTLFAEDVTRGYRIDVWERQSNTWFSLNRRHGTYQFKRKDGSHRVLNLDDEGMVSTAVTEKQDGSPPALYLTESLFRWAGWSLSVPLPMAALDAHDQPTTDSKGNPMRPSNTSMTPFGMQVDFSPVMPPSLPRLRFGREYALRVRTVDLAGNSVPPESRSTAHQLPAKSKNPLPYRRFDPVPGPVVALRYPLQDADKRPYAGEHRDRLVIRSDVNMTTSQYTSLLQSHGFAGYLPFAARHIIPPKTSAQMVEMHGGWDGISGMDAKSYDVMVGKDGDLPSSGVIGTDKIPPLPYLPDPMSVGASLTNLPGQPAYSAALPLPIQLQPFDGTWPNLKSFLLHVRGIPANMAPKAPSFDASSRILTVELPQGTVRSVLLSSYIRKSDLQNLSGIWQWIVEKNPSDLSTLQLLAIAGLHHMITPLRTLTLVHAVQHPLFAPQFVNLQVKRSIGATDAVLSDSGSTAPASAESDTASPGIRVSGNSTQKVDIEARWTETLDDPIASGPVQRKGSAHAFEQQVSYDKTYIPILGRHQLGDTRHRLVAYSPVATSRYREYFPFSDAQIKANEPGITAGGRAVSIHVPSTARPAAPQVVSTVPAFKWIDGTHPNKVVSERQGRRFRVYLNRPWYSSGDAEKLGVVVLPGSSTESMADRVARALPAGVRTMLQRTMGPVDPAMLYEPYVSQFGSDPIWSTSGAVKNTSNPGLNNFIETSATAKNLILDERPDLKVNVAAYDVQFDPHRKLWFADIAMAGAGTGDYFPFVRLALARYQPFSLPGVEISRIALSDFVQITPDRAASVTIGSNNRDVSVSASGVSFSFSVGGGDLGGKMEVTLEANDQHGDQDLGWLPVKSYVMSASVTSGNTTWSANFQLPAPRTAHRYRLVLKEYEQFNTDADPILRLVYAATLSL